jgi:serine/threonine protein kinase
VAGAASIHIDARLTALVRRSHLYYKLAVTDLAQGSAFAGYRIDELAGRGGMGVVYRATDLDLERTVALKLISADLSDSGGFRRRFQAESKIAASLDHPNVIPLFHAGEHDGLLYLVMRYVEGQDLRDEIDERGRLSPERAVSITAQIASALDAAHAKGLVHRDVKPANVLLAPGDHAYLTDFGLTKRLLADSEDTATENLLGTLDYVAPEQIRGQEVGPRTDVYALGCVLFHALTGRPPFSSLEREAKLWAHVSEPPEPLGAGIPTDLDGVIARAMAKEPSARFDSASDLAEAAAEALSGDPTSGPEPAPRPAGSAPASTTAVPPPARRDYGRALIVHALRSPFSLSLLGGTLLAGLVFGVFPIAVPVALLIYAAAAAVIVFDSDVQQRILERERSRRPGARSDGDPDYSQPALEEGSSSPRIAALLGRAAEKQARINDAIERAELPYAEVSEEVESLIATIGQIAARAELLEEGLRDAPPDAIAARLEQLDGEEDPSKEALVDALRAQLAVQQRLGEQLDRFYRQMEQILVEFDTIRGQLVSLSASTDAGNQRRIASRVHSLREEAASVAAGMESAYADRSAPIEGSEDDSRG